MKYCFLTLASLFFLSNTSLAATEDLDFLLGSYFGYTSDEYSTAWDCSVTAELAPDNKVSLSITVKGSNAETMFYQFNSAQVENQVKENDSQALLFGTYTERDMTETDVFANVSWSKTGNRTELGLKSLVVTSVDAGVRTIHECLKMRKGL